MACPNHRHCSVVVDHWHCYRAPTCTCVTHLAGMCTLVTGMQRSLVGASLQAHICLSASAAADCKAHRHACRQACLHTQSAPWQLLLPHSFPHPDEGMCLSQPRVGYEFSCQHLHHGTTQCAWNYILLCCAMQHSMAMLISTHNGMQAAQYHPVRNRCCCSCCGLSR